jgi:site-specific DNA-methyltransferase (adenine-specific)
MENDTKQSSCSPLPFGFYNMDCMTGMKCFPDKYFDLAIVDPVYGDVTNGGYMKNQIRGGVGPYKDYDLSIWQQQKTGQEYFDELFNISQNSQCWVVWDKRHPDGITFADCELAWTSFNSASRIFRYRWNGMLQENMKDKEIKIHPTQKPVALYEWLLQHFAKEDDIILDTHVGSASSLIACHETGHKYIGFEISRAYYAKALKRLQEAEAQLNIFDFTSKKERTAK